MNKKEIARPELSANIKRYARNQTEIDMHLLIVKALDFVTESFTDENQKLVNVGEANKILRSVNYLIEWGGNSPFTVTTALLHGILELSPELALKEIPVPLRAKENKQLVDALIEHKFNPLMALRVRSSGCFPWETIEGDPEKDILITDYMLKVPESAVIQFAYFYDELYEARSIEDYEERKKTALRLLPALNVFMESFTSLLPYIDVTAHTLIMQTLYNTKNFAEEVKKKS